MFIFSIYKIPSISQSIRIIIKYLIIILFINTKLKIIILSYRINYNKFWVVNRDSSNNHYRSNKYKNVINNNASINSFLFFKSIIFCFFNFNNFNLYFF